MTERELRNRVLTILDRHEDMQQATVAEEESSIPGWVPSIRYVEDGQEFVIIFMSIKDAPS